MDISLPEGKWAPVYRDAWLRIGGYQSIDRFGRGLLRTSL